MAGIAGAMVLTFVKGPEIQIASHVNLMNHRNNSSMAAHGGGGRTVLGSVCALASGISYALWLIIQTKMSERYPSYYSSTALMSLWAALLSTAFALSVENDWSQWRLGWNIRLLTVAYSGMVVSGMMVAVISWCVRKRGPLFASVFSPLLLVIVAVASSTVLNEKLYLGSFIGAVLIVCGLYAVLWGKSRERKKMKNMSQLPQCPHDDDDDTLQVIVTRSNSKVGEDRKSNNNGHVDDNQGSIDHGNNNKGITRDQEQEEEKQNDEEGISPNAEDIIPSVVI